MILNKKKKPEYREKYCFFIVVRKILFSEISYVLVLYKRDKYGTESLIVHSDWLSANRNFECREINLKRIYKNGKKYIKNRKFWVIGRRFFSLPVIIFLDLGYGL